jgi:Tol biopolymer transport system component
MAISRAVSAFAAAAIAAIFLASCGGGGGGDAAPGGGGAPGPGTPSTNPNRSGQMVYFYNNRIYSVTMATGVSRELADTLNAKPAYVAHSLSPSGALAIAYYSDGFNSTRAPYSRLVLYKPDGTLEKSIDFDFEIISAPSFSPDGQTIALLSKKSSGMLNVPPTYATSFINRDGAYVGDQLNYATFVDWLPDGRLVFKFSDASGFRGLALTKMPIAVGNPVQILSDTTKDAGYFAVSPDGSKIAFTARASSVSPSHIFMTNIDDTNRRQVTTSRNDEESRVQFSLNGKELLITAGDCTVSAFSGDSHVIQAIPADATMLDVTYETSKYVLKVNAQKSHLHNKAIQLAVA